MVTKEMIKCCRINYKLDDRTYDEAFRWWHDKMNGMAPAGAVAALGLCLDEIERLREVLKSKTA
jgi:hypothetical protein